MLRYIDADQDLINTFKTVMTERFPVYATLDFKLVFDTKPRLKDGKMVFASIELPSAKLKYFSTDDDVEEGYNYIMFVFLRTWELASVEDKRRIISHELRHVFIDENGNPKLIGHEIADFYAEIELNKDDPEWLRKLTALTQDVVDQEKELAKSNTGGKK